ncbi:MAG TPA: transcriptional activator NhaR [Polyangiaceae bacterium]|mgnify:CR=1 FL=1|nr:transcriptional activator NhaR [Polyangiaceae bacterium]
MEWVNYHHLLYFWMVAREGGLVPAAQQLKLSHSTLSTQIKSLEQSLGQELFTKVGRKLALTEAGHVAYRYADEIFSLGREMVDTVKGRARGQPLRLHVGIADVVPKLIVRRLLEPALKLAEPVRLICREDDHDRLVAELDLHTLHLVISDAPVSPGNRVRAHSHLLGESGVSFFGTPPLVRAHRRKFPDSLNDAPLLLPMENLTLRRSLNRWFESRCITPQVVAEFEDSALLKVFGAAGRGLFPAPTAVATEVMAQYGVKPLGAADGVRERFYAISAERRVSHPAVLAILDGARTELFSEQGP